MKEPITMLITRSTGAQAPSVLPPVHPECKVVFRFEIKAGVRALLQSGQLDEANELMDALLRVCPDGPHRS
jgi:hypothetical protein